MTRRSGPERVRSILVPVDGSPSSRRAVELAAQMSQALGATLRLVSVAPVIELPTLIGEMEEGSSIQPAQRILREGAQAARRHGAAPTMELLRGHPAAQILRSATAHRPDLIIMGTRGLTGARSILMGSVSRTVSRRAKTQVVLVR
jgi:nucleotide-binding universal stress UspA family protein